MSQVYFGTSTGQLLVMDVHGTMVAQVSLLEDTPITALAWSCQKFKMEETEESRSTSGSSSGDSTTDATTNNTSNNNNSAANNTSDNNSAANNTSNNNTADNNRGFINGRSGNGWGICTAIDRAAAAASENPATAITEFPRVETRSKTTADETEAGEFCELLRIVERFM